MGEECKRLYGAPCYVAHRADLLGLLQRALPMRRLRLDHLPDGPEQGLRDAEFSAVNLLRQSAWLHGQELPMPSRGATI